MNQAFDDNGFQKVDVAILVALALEATPLIEAVRNAVQLRSSSGMKITIGQLGHRRVAVVATGVGREAALQGARLAIEGHRPGLLVIAGLCGGLDPSLQRGDVVIATSVTKPNGQLLAVRDPAGCGIAADLRGAAVVTADHVVETPEAKQQLRESTDADVVDMESWWIADVAEAAGVPWTVIRSISDTASERIPTDVAKLASVAHPARLAGAAARLLFRRPSAIADLAELREHACSAADRLAKQLIPMIGR
jgi:adenosylhomocysteine nucleosidase